MIKNYSESSFEKKMKPLALQPKKETISFIINFSKSINIIEGTVMKQIRFDKN